MSQSSKSGWATRKWGRFAPGLAAGVLLGLMLGYATNGDPVTGESVAPIMAPYCRSAW